jgi:hypothetical protein
VAACLWVAVLGSGCDLDVPPPALATPCVRVASVWVTTGYDSAGLPLRTKLEEGTITEGVAATTRIEIALDRFALPATVSRQAVCVRASTAPVEQLAQCVDPVPVLLEPSYSVARRRAIYHQLPGAALAPSTLYRVTIYPPTDAADFGFRAFDRAPLERSYAFDFRTAPPGASQREESAPSADRYCAAVRCATGCRESFLAPATQQECISSSCDCLDAVCFGDGDLTSPAKGLFGAGCSGSGCHSGGNPAVGIPWGQGNAAMGLDLASADAIEWTAINQVAHETETGEMASSPEITPNRFGRSMPIVMPSSPGNSYLVYKVASQLPNHPPADQLDVDFQAEVERLRASMLVGAPMPLAMPLVTDVPDPDGTRSWERLLLLEAWVGAGAVTRCP